MNDYEDYKKYLNKRETYEYYESYDNYDSCFNITLLDYLKKMSDIISDELKEKFIIIDMKYDFMESLVTKYKTVVFKCENYYEILQDEANLFSGKVEITDIDLIDLAKNKLLSWEMIEKHVDKKLLEENKMHITMSNLQF